MAERFRIIDCHPYLDREEEYAGLTLEEAALRMEDLTGVGADTILADFGGGCERCHGKGRIHPPGAVLDYGCPECLGTGKRFEPWEWVDDESGREVTMRREVE